MTISLNEIDLTSKVPAVKIELDIEAGASGKGVQPRAVYILAERVAAGTSSANEVKSAPFGTWSEAETWFGASSPGSYMAAIAFQSTGGYRVPIYGVALAAPTGAAAAGKFTFAGNVGTAGAVTLRVAGLSFQAYLAAGNTPSDSVDACIAAWNALPAISKPPVLPTKTGASSEELTFTANWDGSNGNSIRIEVVEQLQGTQTCTASGATLAAGSGVPTLTTALANLASVRTHYLAYSGYTQAELISLKSHMNTKADGNNMLGGRLVAGLTDTVANGVTLMAAVDSNDAERVVLAQIENGKSWEPAIAASMAIQLAALNDVAVPVNWSPHNMLVAPDASDRFTDTECNTLLAGGITPLRAQPGEVTVQTVRCVVGRMDIESPLDNAVMEVYDEIRDRILAKQQVRYAGFKVKESGQDVHTANCTTPEAILADTVVAVFKEMEEEDKVQGVDAAIDSFVAEYVAGGQVRWRAPASVVRGLHQIYGQIAGTSV